MLLGFPEFGYAKIDLSCTATADDSKVETATCTSGDGGEYSCKTSPRLPVQEMSCKLTVNKENYKELT